SSEDDIVSGTLTPVTTPEDSDAPSAEESVRSRAEHSPYYESLIDSPSPPVSNASQVRGNVTPGTTPQRGGASIPQAGTSGGRSCPPVNSSRGKTPNRSRDRPPSTSRHDEPSPNRRDRPVSSGQGGNKRAKGRTSKSKRERPKKRRYRPGALARLEIRKLQSSWNLIIPKLPFQRLVREITVRITNCPDLKYQGVALEALQEAAEAFLVGLLEDSYLLALASRRVTLMARDVQLAIRIKGGL
ncbi:unnamed protein product, partial [Allacma fusca]